MKQKLYTKEPNGRYKEYIEPEIEDNSLYRKVGKKYVRVGVSESADALGEGVWVICKCKSSKTFTSEEYLRKLYRCTKAADIKKVSAAEIGGMEKLAHYLSSRLDELDGSRGSRYDYARRIVGILFDYDKEKEEK